MGIVISAIKPSNKLGIKSNKHANQLNARTTFAKLLLQVVRILKPFKNGERRNREFTGGFHSEGDFVHKQTWLLRGSVPLMTIYRNTSESWHHEISSNLTYQLQKSFYRIGKSNGYRATLFFQRQPIMRALSVSSGNHSVLQANCSLILRWLYHCSCSHESRINITSQIWLIGIKII